MRAKSWVPGTQVRELDLVPSFQFGLSLAQLVQAFGNVTVDGGAPHPSLPIFNEYINKNLAPVDFDICHFPHT